MKFTGWIVSFPTEAKGYEFQIRKLAERDNSEPDGAMPEQDDMVYLLMSEARDHLELALVETE